MAQRPQTAHSPQRPREELVLRCAVPVAFVEIRPQIVTLEVGEDVLDHEWLLVGHHQGWIPGAVVHRVKQRGGCCEQAIENAVDRVKNSVYVRYPTVLVDRKVLNVTTRAANLVEDLHTVSGARVLLAGPRLEVVEEVEFEMIYNGRVDFVAVE